MIEFDVLLKKNGAAASSGPLVFGYAGNRNIYQLNITVKDEWEGATLRAIWHLPTGEAVSSLVSDGVLAVPIIVTAKSGKGTVVFEGTNGDVVVASANMHYLVNANSGIESDSDAWQAEQADSLTDTEEREKAEFTNQIPLSVDSTGAIFNDGLGYKTGYVLTTKGDESASGEGTVTGWIPCKKGDIIRIKQSSYELGWYVALNTAAGVSTSNVGKNYNTIMTTSGTYGTMTEENGVITWDTSGIAYWFWNDFAYARFTVSKDAIITVNEEIVYTAENVTVLKESVKVKKASLDFDIEKGSISGKAIVVFGDSIIGGCRDTTSIPARLAAYSGANVYNVGFGGCRMSVHPTSGYAAFSMWALADAIASGDWSLQEAQAASGSDYFADQLAILEKIDWTAIDVIVIHYGTNDFNGGAALDDSSDTDSTSTVCGALRYSLEKICAAYPKIKIYVSLPVYRMWSTAGAESYTNSQSKTLPEYNAAMKTAAEAYNIPVLDGYAELGINKLNDSAYSADGTHLNEYGRDIMGRWLSSKIN